MRARCALGARSQLVVKYTLEIIYESPVDSVLYNSDFHVSARSLRARRGLAARSLRARCALVARSVRASCALAIGGQIYCNKVSPK